MRTAVGKQACWALVAVLGLGSMAAEPTQAAVLCQRKGKVKIRPDACKGKETVVQDLAALQAATSDLVDQQFRLTCVGAPELVKAGDDTTSFYYDNISCLGGCRTHDGNQSACEGAWAVSGNGATSCVFVNGFCVPCADCVDRRGACQNRCRTPGPTGTCPADPTRTSFLGGPRTDACRKARTQADCEKSFHLGQGDLVASCAWDAGSQRCFGCGPRRETNGDCTNTCRTRTCADASRTMFKRCTNIGNDSVTCAASWHLAARNAGEPASCWFDAVGAECKGCGIVQEVAGFCTNTCR
jgi:hypothetical protein